MPIARPGPTRTTLAAHEVAGLVERARGGDLGAFERLIAEHQAKVFTFALAFASDRDQAADLAQEALVKVYRSLGTFRFQSAFSTWLYSIVKNVYLDWRKSRARREREREQPLDRAALAHADEQLSVEDRLVRDEARDHLLQALSKVPPHFRVVVVMADVQGFGYDEIAQALDVPVGTVKSRLARGRDALRAVLFANDEEAS
jgi:RNA polymerase sigma-70 factor (ECF subfamily)